MSYEYNAMLYDSVPAAVHAAVENFVYGGGENSIPQVAEMDPAEIADELMEHWPVLEIRRVPDSEGSVEYALDREEALDIITDIIREARDEMAEAE